MEKTCPQCGHDLPARAKECAACGWTHRSEKTETITLTEVPSSGDLAQHRRNGKKIIYQCCRCHRTDQIEGIQIVTCQRHFYCLDHYRERRLELAYSDNAFPEDWREQEIAAISARHPEWQRRADETRTQYGDRMLAICREKINALNKRMTAPKQEALGV